MSARILPGQPGTSVPATRPPAFRMRLLLWSLCLAPAAAIAAHGPVKQKEILFPDGKLKERYSVYLDDQNREVREGLDEEFYPGGGKKGQITWQDGKENGLVTYYYPDGRKSYEANYREGKKNGYATVWYPSGQKQWQTVFRESLTNGLWREWYADGKRKFEANYSDGKLDGLATWWYENGHIWQERSFQDGVLMKGTVKEWDRAGRQTFPPRVDAPADSVVYGAAAAPRTDSAMPGADAGPEK